MPTVEAPDIETFTPVDSYRVLGVGYLTMRGPNGVRLDVSEIGAARIDQDPTIAPLLDRMGDFIARNGHYDATKRIARPYRELGDIIRVGEDHRLNKKLGYRKSPRASVYHPDLAPGVITKAYDYNRISAGFQFYLGAWLHDRLARADNGVRSVAQLAMFRASRFGHRTTVMDYAQGESLGNLALDFTHRDGHAAQEVDAATDRAIDAVRQKIRRAAGWRGSLMTNDLYVRGNVIVDDPETATLGTLPDRQFTIIDQPVVKLHNFGGLALARYLPQLGAPVGASNVQVALEHGAD